MKKKRILVKFYSLVNLGDDLFIKILSEAFPDCKISLIENPRCRLKERNANTKTHIYSYICLFLNKLQTIFGLETRISGILRSLNQRCFEHTKSVHDAYVQIGGSIFMTKRDNREEIDFQTSESPVFSIDSALNLTSKEFIIGANLGPAYNERYWSNIKKKILQYSHVCLRDYSSYLAVGDLANVQYAPDVIFALKKPDAPVSQPSVIISVINIENHTSDKQIITSYYLKLAEAANYFIQKNIHVSLISFCSLEGDEKAIEKLKNNITDSELISVYNYRGDSVQILDIFASSLYVIGSRFHSIILGMSFGKPVFPIMYNCKTSHYLADLKFAGRKAALQDLPFINCDTIISNFETNYIVNCDEHKKYAKNQFWGLRQYLSGEFGRI